MWTHVLLRNLVVFHEYHWLSLEISFLIILFSIKFFIFIPRSGRALLLRHLFRISNRPSNIYFFQKFWGNWLSFPILEIIPLNYLFKKPIITILFSIIAFLTRFPLILLRFNQYCRSRLNRLKIPEIFFIKNVLSHLFIFRFFIV